MASGKGMEDAYGVAANLLNAPSWENFIFGTNTTDMINRVALAVNRWHYFVGRQTTTSLAETAAKVHGGAAHVDIEGNGLSE